LYAIYSLTNSLSGAFGKPARKSARPSKAEGKALLIVFRKQSNMSVDEVDVLAY